MAIFAIRVTTMIIHNLVEFDNTPRLVAK